MDENHTINKGTAKTVPGEKPISIGKYDKNAQVAASFPVYEFAAMANAMRQRRDDCPICDSIEEEIKIATGAMIDHVLINKSKFCGQKIRIGLTKKQVVILWHIYIQIMPLKNLRRGQSGSGA
jgi:hypothetical protein